MALQPVENNTKYMKDTTTGNVVNTDNNHYNARRKKILAEKQKADEINSMKNEIEELKTMLKLLLQE